MQVIRKTLDQLSGSQLHSLDSHSLFTSINFLRLWEQSGGTPVFWTAENEDGFVILPAIEYGISKLKRLQSLTDGLYTNLVASDSSLTNLYKNEILTAISKHSYAKVFIFDFENQMDRHSMFEVEELSTILVDISDDDWIPPDKKLQSEIRKAEREAIDVEMFEPLKHMDKFLKLMSETEKRHGRKPKYSEEFYIQLAQLSNIEKRILWYWCEYENTPVTTHINFIERDMVLHWQVFYDKQYSFLKANQKIIYDMVHNTKSYNLKRLNLGASPPDAESLVDYKLKYGGEIYLYNMLSRKSIAGKML